MINYKRNLLFALGALGAICYFTVPGFYETGDFWQIVNAAGHWYIYGILAIVCQAGISVADGISKDKGSRTMMTEVCFVIPMSYVIAVALLCGGVRLWHTDPSRLKSPVQEAPQKPKSFKEAQLGIKE